MNATYKQFLSALLVCLVSVWGTGCASTKTGEVVDTVRKKKEEVGDSYSIDEVTPRSSGSVITLEARRVPKIKFNYLRKREKLRKVRWDQISVGSALFVSNAAGLAVLATDEIEGKHYLWATVLSAPLVWFAPDEEDLSYEPTGDHIYEKADTRTEESSPQSLPDEPVVLRLEGTRKRYSTGSDGQITIDPVQDFGIRSVEDPSPLVATAILPEREHTQSVSLDPREWMVPYARLQSETPPRTRPSSDAGAAQTAERGEELRITDTEIGWLEVRRSGKTSWISKSDAERFWSVPTRLDPSRPPSVAASVEFSEPSGNDRLDADETATVRVTARNEGKGPAHRVRAYLESETRPHLSYPQSVEFGRIGAGQSETETIRIEADREISSEEVALTFRFQEANGFAPSPKRLRFETREFIPPELTVADVGIDDASGNGVIEPGEVVDVTARIRNASRGGAGGVSAQVNFEGENVFAGPDTRQSFDLGDLGPGEHQDIRFSLLTSQQAESVPVTLDLSERYGGFGRKDVKLPLQFDTPTDQITEVQVEGQETDVAVQNAGQLSVDIETNIPTTEMDRPDAVAVVIGVRSYSAEGAPDVEYARRDARFVRKYLTQTLGFREENILPRNPDGRMTYAELRTLIQQKLPSYVKEGTSEVFVYYSGHGAPSTGEEKRAYLVPSDTDPNFVSEANAYRMEHFYEDLAQLDAKSVTVALDACFTGQAGSGEMMLRQASPLALSVENPLLGIENATGFLAAGPEQVANWYPKKKHGMFTYFFLKGLKGKANLNSDRQVTVREMQRYLTDKNSGVPYWSGRVHQREQMPQVVSQNPSDVLVQYEQTRTPDSQ